MEDFTYKMYVRTTDPNPQVLAGTSSYGNTKHKFRSVEYNGQFHQRDARWTWYRSGPRIKADGTDFANGYTASVHVPNEEVPKEVWTQAFTTLHTRLDNIVQAVSQTRAQLESTQGEQQ